MKPRLGLQLQFFVAIVLLLAAVILVMVLLWNRQQVTQHEVSEVTRAAMHDLLSEQVRVNGEAEVRQLADALANPLYYFDLDAIGTLARAALRESDVDYVLVYDPQGRVLHDGSGDIAAYGQPMGDPLAAEVIGASGPQTRGSGQILDVSSPVMIGDQRLGGVRIGYSLAGMLRAETLSMDGLRSRIDEVGRRNLAWLLLLSAGLGLAGLVAAVLLQRVLVRPIRMLGDAAREIEAGNFAMPVPESLRQDELGDLVRTFGRMRESVARHDRDIRRVAYSDALTGLSNRLAFRESLDQRLRSLQGAGRQLALLFADLDNFKRVNDTLGHEAGDEVLLQVAGRIDHIVKSIAGAEALVARFGGDEFVILVQASEARRNDIDVRALRRAWRTRWSPPRVAAAVAWPPGVPGLVDRRGVVSRRCDERFAVDEEWRLAIVPGQGRGRTASVSTAGPWTRRWNGACGWSTTCVALGRGELSSPTTDLRTRDRGACGRRGAVALGPSRGRGDRPGGVHRRGRAERVDRGDRPRSPACGLPRGSDLAAAVGRRRGAFHRGQRVAATAAQR